MQKMKREIGKGSAGTIYLASLKETNVAVKKLNNPMVQHRRTSDPREPSKDNATARNSTTNGFADKMSSASWRSLHREVRIPSQDYYMLLHVVQLKLRKIIVRTYPSIGNTPIPLIVSRWSSTAIERSPLLTAYDLNSAFLYLSC